MSRSGYTDDWDEGVAMWRGQVANATRGKRGQKFFRDLVAALDAMPTKRLISGALEVGDGEVCALGAIGKAKGVDVKSLDAEDHDKLGATFNIARQLAAEVMWVNDERYDGATPEERWARVRKWAASQIRVTEDELLPAPRGDTGEGEP